MVTDCRALVCMLAWCASGQAYSLVGGRMPMSTTQSSLRAIPLMQADESLPGDAEPEVEEPVVVEAVPAVEQEPTDVDDFEFDADESTIAKEALKAEVADGLRGARPDRAVVGEILLALEACNPTRSPATSPLLNGKWKILYASGASPGLKAFQTLLKYAKLVPKSPSGADLVDIQDAYLTIGPDQPRCVSSVATRVLSLDNIVKLTSRLEAESAVRLCETYDSAESEYLSLKLPFQNPIQYKRSVLVSYLDDDLLVVRDSLGRPDILMRCDEVASPAPSAEASVEDDSDPGVAS